MSHAKSYTQFLLETKQYLKEDQLDKKSLKSAEVESLLKSINLDMKHVISAWRRGSDVELHVLPKSRTIDTSIDKADLVKLVSHRLFKSLDIRKNMYIIKTDKSISL